MSPAILSRLLLSIGLIYSKIYYQTSDIRIMQHELPQHVYVRLRFILYLVPFVG